jgi:hypothetical protein
MRLAKGTHVAIEKSAAIQQAIEYAWDSVQGLTKQAEKDGHRFYNSNYRRGELEFNMSDGEAYGRGRTLNLREWFRERGLRCMRADGLEIKAAVDAKIKALGIARDKGITALR